MEQEISIDIRELYEIIKKRAWLIAAVTIASVFISAILSFFIIPPTYEAKTSIIIGKNEQDQKSQVQYNDVMMYQKLVKTYSEIAKTRFVAEKTAEKLGNGITAEQVLGSVSITPQADTQIIIMKASGKEPDKIMNIVNEHANTFVEESQKLYPAGTVKIMDAAVLPKSPVKPRPMLNIAIALFLGLMISFGAVFIMEYMDNTVKTEEDIQKYIGLPVIGVIPKQIEG